MPRDLETRPSRRGEESASKSASTLIAVSEIAVVRERCQTNNSSGNNNGLSEAIGSRRIVTLISD